MNDATEGNLISGNHNNNIGFFGSGTTVDLVAGNLIGTNAAGTAALRTVVNGIWIGNGTANLIGTNGDGVSDILSETSSRQRSSGIQITRRDTANVVAGNEIGTDQSGSHAIGNYAGVEIDSGISGNLIGTNGDGVNDALERNVISGNTFAGVWGSRRGD